MTLCPSRANEGDIDCYTQGACHHLAIALHRNLGWIIDVRTDAAEPYWQDEQDPDNFIPAVLHVYAIDPQGRAWDVRGCRPEHRVGEEVEAHFLPGDAGSEECRNERELRSYVGCWGEDGDGEPVDRPLDEYSDADIDQAWQMAVRIFADMPGFDPTATRQPRRSQVAP